MNIVKKVKPYPMSCGISRAEGQPLIPCEIIKLTEIGFLIRIASQHLLRVGDNLNSQFHIPTVEKSIQEKVKVVKTYHALEAGSPGAKGVAGVAAQKLTTLELHFRSLQPSHLQLIQEFLQKTGQE